MATGCVYFVQATVGGGLIKIGKATNFASRLSAIRSQSPVPIRVLGVIEADRPDEMEATLHQRFAALRVRGEWFTPSPAMLGFINRSAVVPEDEWMPTFCQLLAVQRRFADLPWSRA
jgi:hypothetical protein